MVSQQNQYCCVVHSVKQPDLRTSIVNRPYTFSYFSWEIPILQPMHRFSFSFSKVGIPPLKINIFQRFEYRKNRAVSAVLMVFETLTHIDFQGGNTHFF